MINAEEFKNEVQDILNEIFENADINSDEFKQEYKNILNEYFRDACREDEVEFVEFLLCSPELPQHADISYESQWGLSQACEHSSYETLEFLLISPKLKEKADIYQNDNIIKNTMKQKNYAVLELLLTKYQVQLSMEQKFFAQELQDPKLDCLLEKVSLKTVLEDNLSNNENKPFKLKM